MDYTQDMMLEGTIALLPSEYRLLLFNCLTLTVTLSRSP